jgi:hypothetical protein
MSDVTLEWERSSAAPVTAEKLRRWEQDHAMRLPAVLAAALRIQNGGRVRASELCIDPLDAFSTLDEEPWTHVCAEGPLAGLDRGRLLYVGEAAGCGIVLDYATTDEPRVLLVHHNLGGDLRAWGGSFEDLLRAMQTPPDEGRRTSRR